MNARRQRQGHLLAAGLASVTAAIHLYLGLAEIIAVVTAGHHPDLLPIFFGISAIAIVAGMLAFYWGAPRQPIYLLGMLLMIVYLVGYADWHVFGTVEGLLGLDQVGHGHVHDHGHADEGEERALQLLIAHLIDDPFALVSKVTEFLLLILLGLLSYNEARGRSE